MPKQVITQAAILDAAMEMTREKGFGSVNARSVAEFMGRSVQPIYSYFQNMRDLKDALLLRAMEYYDAFIRAHADMLNLESMSAANIRFARQEPNLFRLLFLTESDGYRSFADIFARMGKKDAAHGLAAKLKITDESAQEIYIMMIIFTHGIATMLATGGADVADEEITEMIKSAYSSFVCARQNKAD